MSESSLRVTYTRLAGLIPPQQGAVIRFDGIGQDGRSFRVTNEPKADEDGTFTIEFEPI